MPVSQNIVPSGAYTTTTTTITTTARTTIVESSRKDGTSSLSSRSNVLVLCSMTIVLLIVRQFSFVDFQTHLLNSNGNKYTAIEVTARSSEPVSKGAQHHQQPTIPNESVMISRPSYDDPNSGTNMTIPRAGSKTPQIPKKSHRQHHLHHQSGGFQKRYANTPFKKGYKATGGPLPADNGDYLFSPRMWKYVDNNTCIIHRHKNVETVGSAQYNNSSIHNNSSVQTNNDDDLDRWQHRAPYAILLGGMKCGTHALTESLWEHPLVARNGHWELHFFDSDRPVRSTTGIDHWRSREVYAKAFRVASPEFFHRLEQEQSHGQQHQQQEDQMTITDSKNTVPNDNDSNNNTRGMMIAMESSPRYLLNSDRLPHLIVCVVPWVKLLVLLRDPIARAASHYRYLDESRRQVDQPMVDWKTWIEDDIRLLDESGFWNASTREEERLAWKIYQRRPNSNMIVGRGLYVVQLLDYYDAMDARDKPRSDMLILQSERFRNERQMEYNRVLDFLQLPPHTLQNPTDEVHGTVKNKTLTTPMPDSIRRQLQTLYRPYNERLYALLGWDKVWDM